MNTTTPLWLDRVAVNVPNQVYELLEAVVSPEIVAEAAIVAIAAVTVALAVSFTTAKPKRAALPDPKLPLYHPSDNDNCKYIVTTRAAADFGDTTLKAYQVALVPLVAAVTLAGLYWVMQQTPELVNWYLNWMFCLGLPMCAHDTISQILTVFDRWRWVRFQRYAVVVVKDDTLPAGPMDGDLDAEEVHQTYPDYVTVWPAPAQVDVANRVAHYVTDGKGIIAIPLAVGLTYLFWLKNPGLHPDLAAVANWVVTNAALFAYTVTGIALLQLARFSHACLMLLGLFVYDIYFVFATPMMETVARGLDVPIKFIVPRADGKFMDQMFLLIGTGDLVVPGVFLLLLLRFDYHQYYSKRPTVPFHHARQIPRPYFRWGMVFYTLGLVLTMVAMHTSQRGQPALLYIVPCLLLGTLGLAHFRGEIGAIFSFDDEIEMKPPLNDIAVDDSDASDDDEEFELDSYDEWVERVEQKRDELIADTDDDDPIVYQFLLDDDDDHTFVIGDNDTDNDSGDNLDSDGGAELGDGDGLADEIIAIRQELARPPQEWYSDDE